MTIQEFEEKGGVVIGGTHATLEEAVLDPKTWETCGKVEGWGVNYIESYGEGRDIYLEGWKAKIHQMIDALCEGKSLEEFIETL